MAAKDENIWYFDVSDPTTHSKGFTIYKVTAKYFPVNSPESLTEVVIWKRYNDFKHLYKSMTNLHRSLHRRDEFPPFAKPKLFGRFDDSVIEERRTSALELLNFIGLQSHLYKSQIFSKFLEGGKVIEGLSGKVLKPSKVDILDSCSTSPATSPALHTKRFTDQRENLAETSQNDDAQEISTSTDENSLQSGVVDSELEGVWQYPQVPEKISLNSYEDDTDVDSTLGTPLPDSEISFFDPLSDENGPEDAPTIHTSKSWILEAVNTCAELENEMSDTCNSETSQPQTDKDTCSSNGIQMVLDVTQDTDSDVLTLSGALTQSTSSDVSANKVDITEFDPLSDGHQSLSTDDHRSFLSDGHRSLLSDDQSSLLSDGRRRSLRKDDTVDHYSTSGFMSGSSTSLESSSSANSTPNRTKLVKKTKVSRSPLRQRSVTAESVSTMDLGGKDEYIHKAANQICIAQELEANSNYEQAFATYKFCVEILLTGVQADKNKGRRDAVRRKTAQYLMKAEDLYNRHLAKETIDDQRWATSSTLNPTTEVDPALTFIRGPYSDLKQFKVLGTIDKVILVLDKTTEETYVVKRLYKSSLANRNIPNILPTSCPYMVNLYKFYETPSTIYLLLQYVSGGRLWDYVGAYLQHAQNQGKDGGPGGENGEIINPSERNVYTGFKIHTDDNKRGSFLSQYEQIDQTSLLVLEAKSADDKNNLVKYVKGDEDISICKTDQNKVKDLDIDDFQLDLDRNVLDGDFNVDLDKESLDDVADISVQTSETCDTSVRRYTSFSSEENVEGDNISVRSSQTPLERQNSHNTGQFQDLLQKNKTPLENFSINSIDSDKEITSRQNSILSDNFDVIHEEQNCNIQNDVFIGDYTSYTMNRSSQVNCESDLIESSKELLRCVERTLSQVDTDTQQQDSETDKTKSDTTMTFSSPISPSQLNSASEADSIEEPSIYDLHRPGDTSDSASDTKSRDSVGDGEHVSNGIKESAICEKKYDNSLVNDMDNKSDKFAAMVDTDLSSNDCARSRASTNVTLVPRRFTLNGLNSGELSRSVSSDYGSGSPSKARQRTISHLFEQLDVSAMSPDQIKIPESFIKRWAAEIVVALSRLHAQGIICRELKPENILLGDQGHATLTYFCQINQVIEVPDFEACKRLYVAPEVKSITGYTEVCDWWSLGVLVYELLVGKSLLMCHPDGVTSHTQLFIPEHLSEEAKALLLELLRYNPRERLGSGINGVEEIKAHPFFNGVDWNGMEM